MNNLSTTALCVLLIICFVASEEKTSPVVHVRGGDVLGSVEISQSGRMYYAFQGIPFVKPPGRLEHSEPGHTWEGVLDATEAGVPCAQSGFGVIIGEEDCLHLTVYTPNLSENSSSKALPVLVWFHGGAFASGSASDYSPHLLMDRDMIIVLPQYRLGILGYMTYHSSDAAGNYGMIDQVGALKWVQDNIAAFGGDPERVTLGGDCAGGASAMYHMVSPLSDGLFKRVISFSGSPLNFWSLYLSNDKFMLVFCTLEKCPPHHGGMMRRWLIEQTSLEDLLQHQMDSAVFNDPFIGNYKMGPSVQDPKFEVEEEHWFLRQHPLAAFTSGEFSKVPVLMSITKDIGSYLIDWEYYQYYIYNLEKKGIIKTENEIMRIILFTAEVVVQEDGRNWFRDYYMPEWNKTKTFVESFPELKEMLADLFYRSGILASAKVLSKHVPTRLLSFGYDGGPKLFDLRHPDPETAPPVIPGVSHGDEMFFFLPYEKSDMTDEQKKISALMVDVIENFIYEREPLEQWPTFTTDGFETTFITSDGDVEMGKPFVNEKDNKMLDYIFNEQIITPQERINEKKKKKAEADHLKHEEL